MFINCLYRATEYGTQRQGIENFFEMNTEQLRSYIDSLKSEEPKGATHIISGKRNFKLLLGKKDADNANRKCKRS